MQWVIHELNTSELCSLVNMQPLVDDLSLGLIPGLTKGIIFGHEYGIWLASSQRVLADSEMDP